MTDMFTKSNTLPPYNLVKLCILGLLLDLRCLMKRIINYEVPTRLVRTRRSTIKIKKLHHLDLETKMLKIVSIYNVENEGTYLK